MNIDNSTSYVMLLLNNLLNVIVILKMKFKVPEGASPEKALTVDFEGTPFQYQEVGVAMNALAQYIVDHNERTGESLAPGQIYGEHLVSGALSTYGKIRVTAHRTEAELSDAAKKEFPAITVTSTDLRFRELLVLHSALMHYHDTTEREVADTRTRNMNAAATRLLEGGMARDMAMTIEREVPDLAATPNVKPPVGFARAMFD